MHNDTALSRGAWERFLAFGQDVRIRLFRFMKMNRYALFEIAHTVPVEVSDRRYDEVICFAVSPLCHCFTYQYSITTRNVGTISGFCSGCENSSFSFYENESLRSV